MCFHIKISVPLAAHVCRNTRCAHPISSLFLAWTKLIIFLSNLYHFSLTFSSESQSIRSPTILLRKKYILFFYVADWEKGNCKKSLPLRLFRLLVQVCGSLSIQQKNRVQASDPEGSALATFCVATSSNPRTISQIEWRWRTRSVRDWSGPQYVH